MNKDIRVIGNKAEVTALLVSPNGDAQNVDIIKKVAGKTAYLRSFYWTYWLLNNTTNAPVPHENNSVVDANCQLSGWNGTARTELPGIPDSESYSGNSAMHKSSVPGIIIHPDRQVKFDNLYISEDLRIQIGFNNSSGVNEYGAMCSWIAEIEYI